MNTHARRPLAVLLALALLWTPVQGARAAAAQTDEQAEAAAITPPRLSYASGEVSFWRPGAQDWAPAQINTPLAPGDELYTGSRGTLELQVGARAFVRAQGDTQLGLANQEPDFLQLKVTGGDASIDLRSVEPGRIIEVDTPQAAFTIEHPGYYRVEVADGRTSFVTRRGGRATMTPAGGQAVALASSEEVVLEGAPSPTVRSYVAPELDAWDRWNYARTEHFLEAVSSRYVPPGVYGTEALDQYGTWRVVPSYGSVWVPESVPAGWVPYSTGRWIYDPYYGWSWVDTAPWGWAPFHYGRWVYFDGFWAWAPGPIVVRPVYAPALVAFFGLPGVSVSVGTPFVSWVALGWGEPVVPWWGRSGFVGRPWWGGWGGPRIVNNTVVNRTTVVNVNTINVYRNVTVNNAVVAVNQEHFGRRPVHEARVAQVDVRRLEPVRGPLRVTPAPASFVAASGSAPRPPERTIARPIVATRPMATRASLPRAEGGRPAPPFKEPAPKIVPAPQTAQSAPVPARPPFGASPLERRRPAQPPGPETMHRPESAPAGQAPRPPETTAAAPAPPQAQAPARQRGGQSAAPGEQHAPPRAAPQTSETRRESAPAAPQPAPQAPETRRAPVTALPQPAPQAPEARREPVTAPQTAPRAPETRREPVTAPQPAPQAPETRRAPAPAAPQAAPQPPTAGRPTPAQPQAAQQPPAAQRPPVAAPAPPAARQLPGEPANRLYPGRAESAHSRREEARPAPAQQSPAQQPPAQQAPAPQQVPTPGPQRGPGQHG